jgi:phosphoribosylaminoimidazolecarboxamide formyltransferase/IMP cyclohydrolase
MGIRVLDFLSFASHWKHNLRKKMKTPSTHKIERAIISVSDKTGVVEFAKELSNLGIEIYSTGGTKAKLSEAGVPVQSVSALTNFPEIMDGRVKTLHPAIHSGILADLSKQSHIDELEAHGLKSIDLLVVNLYPFEETLKKEAPHDEMIENIDIGGPTMLRAAAKNYKWTAVVVNPSRYDSVIDSLTNNGCTLPEETRVQLAGEVFEHTARYDSIISNYFNKYNKIELAPVVNVSFKKEQDLRYGENPHQAAALYGNISEIFDHLHGKELSYNNIIDIDSAAKIINEFSDDAMPTVAIVKHTNPCGVGRGSDLITAYDNAFSTDRVSPFGGIIAMNKTLDMQMAEKIHSIFTEVLIAPDFTDEALEHLSKKKDRRLIKLNYDKLKSAQGYELKSVLGGLLSQSADTAIINNEELRVVTDREPSDEEWEAMMFNWKVCKHVKSNAIVYGTKDRTLGIGAGQMSRVDSSRIAVEKSKLMGLDLTGSIVASDAFFPFADGLLEAVQAGATAVIQPGGSVRDDEVIKAANDNNIAMIFTGMRHFKH